MRLEKLQAYLRDKGQEYQYTEEDGCGGIDWEQCENSGKNGRLQR